MLNSPSTSSQMNCPPPITIITAPLPCPTDGNESNFMESTFSSSLDQLDSSDLGEFTMMEDNEHVLSANLSASLQLGDSNISNRPDVMANNQENMSDSFDRIANNTLNELFCEIYTKHN